MKRGCTARSSRTVFLHSIFTGAGASYELTSSWTPSWPGPRADTSWALLSLYKVNYTPGGCHSLHKRGKPEMKPYHELTCQRRDRRRARFLVSGGRRPAAAPTATGSAHTGEKPSGSAGLAGVTGMTPLASGAYFTGLSLRATSGPHRKATWDESCQPCNGYGYKSAA